MKTARTAPATLRYRPRMVLLQILLLLGSITTAGLPVYPAHAQMNVSSVGPDGGVIYALWMTPQRPEVIYASGRGRLFKSTDGAQTWQDITPGDFEDYSRLRLHIASADPEVLYLIGPSGTVFQSRDAGSTWDVYFADPALRVFFIDPDAPEQLWAYRQHGLYERRLVRSQDGGTTWREITFGENNHSGRVWVNPFAPEQAVAEAWCCGDTIEPVGLYVTTNGGQRWTRAESIGAEEIIFDPSDPRTLYAITHEGVIKSTNRGETWRTISADLPQSDVYRLAVAPSRSTVLYLALQSEEGYHSTPVFKSTDGGGSWALAGTAAQVTKAFALTIHPQDTSHLLLGGPHVGVVRSDDGGRSWREANEGIHLASAYLLAAVSGDVLLAGIEGEGVVRTVDGGRRWATVIANRSTGGEHLALALNRAGTMFTNVLPETFYMEDPSWGETGGLAVSHDGGASWQVRRAIHGGPHSFDVSSDGEIIYGGAHLGSVDGHVIGGLIKSLDGGRSWDVVDLGVRVNHVNHIEKIEVDPSDPDVVYVLALVRGDEYRDVLLRTTNGGTSWEVVAEDVGVFFLNRADPKILYYSEADPAYLNPGQSLFVSRDRGTTWAQHLLSDTLGLYDLTSHWDEADVLFASAASGRILLSEDGGANWSVIAEVQAPWHSLVSAPSEPILLFGQTARAGVQRLALVGYRPDTTSPRSPEAPSSEGAGFTFGGSYPNPSRSAVYVAYELRQSAPVSVGIYDVRGRLVRTLLHHVEQSAGDQRVTWDGRDAAGHRVPSGLYFCELSVGETRRVAKVLIVR